MPMCPIIERGPECLKKGCELYVHETQMCCFVDIAISGQFIACMRDLIERFVKVIEADAKPDLVELEEEPDTQND